LPFIEQSIGEQAFLCAEFSLADAGYMALAMVLQVDGMALDAFPRTARYLERLRARASYACISPATSLADSSGRP
jgi:glutathione S-transferase